MSCNCCITDKFKEPVCQMTNNNQNIFEDYEFSFTFETGGFLDGTYLMRTTGENLLGYTENVFCDYFSFGPFGIINHCWQPPVGDNIYVLAGLDDNTGCGSADCINQSNYCSALPGTNVISKSGKSVGLVGLNFSRTTCNSLFLGVSAWVVSSLSGRDCKVNVNVAYAAGWPAWGSVRDTITLYSGGSNSFNNGGVVTLSSQNFPYEDYLGLPSMQYIINDFMNMPEEITLTRV